MTTPCTSSSSSPAALVVRSRCELARMVSWREAAAASWQQVLEEGSTTIPQPLDDSSSSSDGCTSLHRLVALHSTTGADVEAWVCQQTNDPARIHETNINNNNKKIQNDNDSLLLTACPHSGATALHVAVFRNSYHIASVVRALLHYAPELARMPMTGCQSLPLHIYLGHAVTMDRSVLECLLQAHPTAAPNIAGDAPLALLWRNVLRFRWARAWELTGQVPEELWQHDNGDEQLDNHSHVDRQSFWMTVISPRQFLEYALRLVQACSSSSSETLTWHDVCQAPGCPPLLIRMLLLQEEGSDRFVGGSLLQPDEKKGRLPLHWAAAQIPCRPPPAVAVMSPTLATVHQKKTRLWQSVVELLVEAEPSAAAMPDSRGQLPLHLLLALHGAVEAVSCASIRAVVDAFPDALHSPDPVTHLVPALQYATTLSAATGTDKEQELEATDLLYNLVLSDPSCVRC